MTSHPKPEPHLPDPGRERPAARHGRKQIPEPAARGSRTTAQGTLATVLALALNPHLPHLVPHQRAVLVVVLTVLFAAVQAYAEDRGWIPAFGRDVPSAGVPAVDTDTDRAGD